MPEFTKADLTSKEGLEKIGRYVVPEIQVLRDGFDALTERWEQAEAVGRVQKDSITVQLYQNYENRATPVLSSRRKRVVAETAAGILGADPWFQFVPDDKDQKGADELERGMQGILDRAVFSRLVRRAFGTTFDCGITFLKARTVAGKGLVLEHVHPKNMVRGPMHGLDTAHSYLIGNKMWKCEYEVRQLIESGAYKAAKVLGIEAKDIGASDPDDEPAGRDVNFNLAQGQAFADTDKRGIDLYDVLVSLPFVDGGKLVHRTYRMVVSERDGTVLAIDLNDKGESAFIYSRPWYFDLRFHDEEELYWPSTSKASKILPLSLSQAEQFNLMVAGNMGTCSPPFAVTGGVLGEKVSTLGLGEYWESPHPIQFQPFPTQFKAGEMPGLIDKIDAMLDAETGFSRAGMSSEFKSGTSATAAAGAMAAQAQMSNADALSMAESLEPLAGFVAEMCRAHPSEYRKTYGKALGTGFWGGLYNAGRWQLSGRNPGNTPAVLLQKAAVLDEYAQRPDSQWSRDRVEDAVANMMQFPFDLEPLKLTEEEKNERTQREMAMVQGAAIAGPGAPLAPAGPEGVGGVVPGLDGAAGGPVPNGVVEDPAAVGPY